jgi:hypothetical protein
MPGFTAFRPFVLFGFVATIAILITVFGSVIVQQFSL